MLSALFVGFNWRDQPEMLERLLRLLSSGAVVWLAAALACALCLQSLRGGLYSDDMAHGLALRGTPVFPAQDDSPRGLFRFADGDPESNRRARDLGLQPWWSDDRLKLNFLRPLAAITHKLDYAIWPDRPVWMHAHNLLWLGAMCAAAGLAYRGLFGAGVAAGAATLLFAVDDAHAGAASWIAARNTLMCATFGFAAIGLHHRWRAMGGIGYAIGSGAALAGGLASGEAGLAAAGYVAAYAVFMETRPWRSRIFSLAPMIVVCVLWRLAYSGGNHGAFGSGIYIDPVGDSARFATAAIERVPIQLLSQFAAPPADLYPYFSKTAMNATWFAGLCLSGLLVAVLWRLLRNDLRARFLATGMLGAAILNSATLPDDRQLVFVGWGAFGLISLLVEQLYFSPAGNDASKQPPMKWRRRVRAAFPAAMLLIHAVIAPPALVLRCGKYREDSRRLKEITAPLPSPSNQPAGIVDERRVVMINGGPLWGMYIRAARAINGVETPARVHVLAGGGQSLVITRTSERAIEIRPDGGFLAPPGSPLSGEAPLLGAAYLLQRADSVFRDTARRMSLGERAQLSGMTVEVIELTPDGRAAAARFEFDKPLDDPSLVWLVLRETGVHQTFIPPRFGESVRIARMGE